MKSEIVESCENCIYQDLPAEKYPCVICKNCYTNKFKSNTDKAMSLEEQIRCEITHEITALAIKCNDYGLLDLVRKLLEKTIEKEGD